MPRGVSDRIGKPRLALVLCLALLAVGCPQSGNSGGREGPTLELRRPKGGKLLLEGSPVEVSFRQSGLDGETLSVEVSRDEGQTWEEVGNVSSAEREFRFSAPAPQDDLLIRLSADEDVVSNRRRIDVAPAVTMVTYGSSFAVSLRSDGTLRFWGKYPSSFQAGVSPLGVPTPFSGLERIRSVSGGGEHFLAVDEDGSLFLWGDVDGSNLSATQKPVVYPERVPWFDSVLFARAEFSTSFVRLTDGRVFAWGANRAGSLGDGTGESSWDEPVEIPSLHGVLDISLGRHHGLALTGEGRVLAWGWNELGQLGDGTRTNRLEPQPVPGVRNAVAVAAGIGFSVALVEDGTVLTWGWNSVWGSLGRTLVDIDPVPGEVELPAGIVGIACGGGQAYAIAAGGEVFGWGANNRGQLADGTLEDRFSPVECRVPSIRELFVRYGTVHAITQDGRRVAWGSNRTRLAGDGATGDLKDDRPYPVEVIAR